MASVKRTSYPSKQVPAGPAPLASFEDLPSDELESPEDVEPLRDEIVGELNGDTKTKESPALLSSSTLDSLTISAQSTPQVDRDFDSNFTLTPVESTNQSGSGFRTGSLSSLNKEETALAKEKKGSLSSLGNFETPETEYNQRKSSWTDIFRSHNQNVKTSSEQASSSDIKVKSASKTKSESPKGEAHEAKMKEKGKFLSLFKVGKKSSKLVESPVSQSKINSTKEEEEKISDKINNESPDKVICEKDKENEQPKAKEPPVILQVQNDLDKSNSTDEKPKKLSSGEIKITRKNFNISEKDYNIFSAQVDDIQVEKSLNKCETILKNLEDDHESSECELTFDVKAEVEEKKEDEEDEVDFEAEKLLPQDSSEVDDDSACELHPIPVFPSQMTRVSRPKNRTDVATIPVDRPRSTTPINAAPLEAYIRAASPSSDRKGDKIKLCLPGDQFIGHLKSPKKSTTKSWSDFCEEILHSPRAHKKDDFGQSDNALSSAVESKDNELQWNDNNKSPNQWVTFETKSENIGKVSFPDEWPNLISNAVVAPGDNTVLLGNDDKLSRCSCECHSKGCDSVFVNLSAPLQSSTAQSPVEIAAFSDNCQCHCHERYAHLWSPVGSSENNLFSETKSSNLFSDFASAPDAI